MALDQKRVEGGLYTHEYRCRVYVENGNNFRNVQKSNVLIYFRHGFGDLVTFSSILPLLEPSNRYWVTRFGDDYTSILDGSAFSPVYLGSTSIKCSDGGAYGICNFGIDSNRFGGGEQVLQMPISLWEFCTQQNISAILAPGYPEIHGNSPAPYHTKARYCLQALVNTRQISADRLSQPLPSPICFEIDGWLASFVHARLVNYGGLGRRKLCIISRTGYTAHGKNWGHLFREDMPEGNQRQGEEVRDFCRLMLSRDPNWMFVPIEDVMFEGDDTLRSEDLHCYSFAELFSDVNERGIPFGLVMKAMVAMADLAIGVPTGPYHLAMAHPSLPTVGIWLEHHPSWYDEPKANSIHLVSRRVRDEYKDRRCGSFADWKGLHYRIRNVDGRIITGEEAVNAVEELGLL